MKEYYPFMFLINDKKYYCLWYTNEKDGFLVESNKVKHFNNNQELNTYAINHNLKVNEETTVLSIDDAMKWLNGTDKEINCQYFLEFWNVLADLGRSVGDNFYGNTNKSIINKIYHKLFLGNNISAIKREGEAFLPSWSEEEVSELIKVVKDGLRIIDIFLLN